MKKKFEKDSDNFWRRRLTWKSKIGIFRSPDLEGILIRQKISFTKKVLFFHSIQLPFDEEVDEKFLYVV